MKRLSLCLILAASLTGCAGNNSNPAEHEPDYAAGFFDQAEDMSKVDAEGGETNGDLPNPADIPETEETLRMKSALSPLLSFAQTQWNECDDVLTGQYLEYNCVKARNISTILDSFLEKRMMACVDEGMKAQSGGGTTADLHVVHAGITADIRHSPKSLHSYNRAIDVKEIRATLTTGEVRQYTYSKIGNRTFYTALRKCWGRMVHDYNSCPYYGGNPQLTGSIGWENTDHGRHMHLSVPYCVSGKYGAGVWVR